MLDALLSIRHGAQRCCNLRLLGRRLYTTTARKEGAARYSPDRLAVGDSRCKGCGASLLKDSCDSTPDVLCLSRRLLCALGCRSTPAIATHSLSTISKGVSFNVGGSM